MKIGPTQDWEYVYVRSEVLWCLERVVFLIINVHAILFLFPFLIMVHDLLVPLHYITKYWAFDVLLLTRLSASLCNQLVSTNELAHLQDQSPCFASFSQLDIQFIFAFLFF